MKILIAEDDFTSRAVLAGVLQKEGHEVTCALTGLEAWEALRRPDAPALAILDWMMPELDGLEVVRRVRDQQSTTRPPYLIMLTTRDRKEDVVTGLAAGADDYLAKPFDPGELLARVEVGRRMVLMQTMLAARLEALRTALDQIETLRGILPICAHCKNVRDNEGGWHEIEDYISRCSEAQFSHSICPACLVKRYPEITPDSEVTKKPAP